MRQCRCVLPLPHCGFRIDESGSQSAGAGGREERSVFCCLPPSAPASLPSQSAICNPQSAIASADELGLDAARDDAARRALVEQALDGAATALRVVERELVDPHRDEAVGQLRVHVARELHGVVERLAAVRERVADGLVQVAADPFDGLRAEVWPDTGAAHRQRQVSPSLPPLAEVNDLVQTELLVEELPLVYE